MGEHAFTVVGSHGEVWIDADGCVVLVKPQFDSMGIENEYAEIRRFDLEEWRERYGEPAEGHRFDILRLGYWTWADVYEPRVEDFENLVGNDSVIIIPR